MVANKHIYIVIGQDAALKKEELLNRLKQQEFGTLENIHFFPKDSTPRNIDSELSNMSFTKRAFIFHSILSFKKESKEYIESRVSEFNTDYYIFDYGEETGNVLLKKDKIYKQISKIAQTIGSPAKVKENVFFDIINNIRRGNTPSALMFFKKNLDSRDKRRANNTGDNLMLLKGLTTMLAKTKSSRLKRAYLKTIFDTDRLLKEGLVDSTIALETLIVKLCAISRRVK